MTIRKLKLTHTILFCLGGFLGTFPLRYIAMHSRQYQNFVFPDFSRVEFDLGLTLTVLDILLGAILFCVGLAIIGYFRKEQPATKAYLILSVVLGFITPSLSFVLWVPIELISFISAFLIHAIAYLSDKFRGDSSSLLSS